MLTTGVFAAQAALVVDLSGNYQTCTATTGIQNAPFQMTWTTNGMSVLAGGLTTPILANNTPVSAGGAYVGQTIYGSFRNTATSGSAPLIIPSISRVDKTDQFTFTTKGTNNLGVAVTSSLEFLYVFKKADFYGSLVGDVGFDAAGSSAFTFKNAGTWSAQTALLRAVVQNGSTWYISQAYNLGTVNSTSPAVNILSDAYSALWAVWDPSNLDSALLPSSFTVPGSALTDIQALGVYANLDKSTVGTFSASVSTIQIGAVAVPEPATVGMLGLGALVAMLIRRIKS